jgi:hypothetical protein
MPTPEPARLSGALFGRERECSAIDQLLGASAHGESTSLVLRGEAGIGKTALLSYAAERGGKRTVLRIAGVEAESDLGFAGLEGLLRPITGKLDELPTLRRRRSRRLSDSRRQAARIGYWSPPRR